MADIRLQIADYRSQITDFLNNNTMAKKNIIDVLLKTINDVQSNNSSDPNQRTADATVFDMLKDKLRVLDENNRQKRAAKGKSPNSILDLIRKEIEGVKSQNKRDPDVRTAPKSVFKDILRKVEEKPQRRAAKGINSVIQEYRINTSTIPDKMMAKVQEKYLEDTRKLNQQYAQAIHDLAKQYG